ncbi:MAG: glycosyltransferase family 2 protein [Oscillospiraceae bacterium]|nr:glycosyltransferase family 2 protein [Oscillospiraceae bacterium]MCL2278972.1 glycosyltransferase family 2 protein [Oscillospiraceae bacterium]
MSKKKKTTKKRNPARSGNQPHSSATPKISQCMIVKNEEQNIERALSWGKDIVYEQIVVDTGSTDKTVEIAEKMGAKIFHFKWIDDFSAAKNYAIDQATGDWIAFLDADEFFAPEDTERLKAHVKRISADPKLKMKHKVIGCSLYNVGEDGETSSVVDQARIFQNRKEIRYVGRIHEAIAVYTYDVLWVKDIKIIHNSSLEIRAALGKAERNIKLIRAELAENPQNLDLKGYLAEALIGAQKAEYIEEGESLFAELIAKETLGKASKELTRRAFNYTILKHVENAQERERCKELCIRAMNFFPDWLDFEYFYVIILNRMGEHEQALKLAMQCEQKLAGEQYKANSEIVSARPYLLFAQSLIAAQELRDVEAVIKYATYILTADKTNMGVLGPYISTLSNKGATIDELIQTLGSIYNLDDPKDLLTIARAAKDYGAVSLAQKIVEMAGERMGRT